VIGANCGEEVSALEETVEVSVWRAKMHPGGEILACGDRMEAALVLSRVGAKRVVAVLSRGNEEALQQIKAYLLGSTYILMALGRGGTPAPYMVRSATSQGEKTSIGLEAV
jgi:hypothetical protein